MGARCLPDFEIHLREPPSPSGVAGVEPEFGRVIGEGFRVACHQLVVARGCLVAPLGGLLCPTGVAEDTRERCRVIGVVG